LPFQAVTVPSKKETEPVGVSAAPLTATVKVTFGAKGRGIRRRGEKSGGCRRCGIYRDLGGRSGH